MAGLALLHADGEQEGRDEHHERDMTIPAVVAAHFVVIQAKAFAGFQVLFDVPPCPNSLHYGGQRSLEWSPNQVVSQLVWLIQAAAHDKEVSTVHSACMHDGQASPVKEALAFGAQAL